MIKVINVISDMNIGGAGKCLIYFAQNFDREKFDVSVILPKGSALVDELKNTPMRVIEIDGLKDKSWDFKSLWKLIKIFKKEKPDIVHTHASFTARLAARLFKSIKIVYTRHCAYPVSNRIKKGIGHYFYKFMNEFYADRIIAVGNAAEENLLDGGISSDIIETFFNGVEKVKEISEEEKRKLKEKYNIKEDEKVIGIIARLEEVKGQDTFIEAAKILLEEKKLKTKFFILGNGSEEERLKQKVKDLGLSQDIIFTGFVKNVGDFLNIFDVQVNCSFGTETSCLSLLEGMSIGVPAVATNYGGNPYLIKDGENGYIVPIKSARDVAESVYRILTYDEIRNHMIEKSKEIYEEKFTIDIYTKNVERVYEEMESEPRVKKINLLDAVIIIVVIIACLFGYKYISNQQTEVISGKLNKIEYVVRTMESVPEAFNMIEEGTSIYDSLKNYEIGTVTKKELVPTEKYEINLSDGTYEKTELPIENTADIMITIEANASISDQNISIGDYIIKVGKEVFVKGRGYAGKGYIVSIERVEE